MDARKKIRDHFDEVAEKMQTEALGVDDILEEANESYTGADIRVRLDKLGYRIEAKDAPNPEEYMRGFEDGRARGWQGKGQAFFSAPASIRIEALRAAAAIFAAGNGVTLHFGEHTHRVEDADQATIRLAEHFAAWLESGQK